MSDDMTNVKRFRRPTIVAGIVLGAGLLASIAGNVQSILLDDSTPSVGSMISALWWPAILFGMIELAIHTPWGDTPLWRSVRWLGCVVIGGVAFYVSYFHLAHVLSAFGYDVISRYAGPIAVDVAMAVATVAMNRIGVAKAMATGQIEPVATVASTPEPVATLASLDMATGQLANLDMVATEPAVATDDLAADWGSLDSDFDAELADIAAGRIEPPAPVHITPAPTGEVLVTVPALAAKRISAALESGATRAELAALDAALADEGIAGSARTARRWRTAVSNGLARVS